MAKNEVETDARSEDEAGTLRVYELGFHIDPELPQEEVKKTYQGLRDVIARAGEVVAEGEPEYLRLAYVISRQEHAGRRDFTNAQFAWIAYEATPEGHDAVLAAVRGDARVFRWIDVLTTKEEARHAAELRAMKEQAPEKPEEVSDTELDAALENVLPTKVAA